jgi:hypothetical protein
MQALFPPKPKVFAPERTGKEIFDFFAESV